MPPVLVYVIMYIECVRLAAIRVLGIEADVIRDVAKKEKMTPGMLNSVQKWVLKGLCETWYEDCIITRV